MVVAVIKREGGWGEEVSLKREGGLKRKEKKSPEGHRARIHCSR